MNRNCSIRILGALAAWLLAPACIVQQAPPPGPVAQPQPQPGEPEPPDHEQPEPPEPGPDEPSPGGVPADFSISLERTVCFGSCPIYKVTVDASGHVRFDGQRFVAQTGVHEADIADESVAALHEAVVSDGFFALKDCYCERRVTDMPSSIVTVTMDGKTKTVRHYKGDKSAPAAYLELEAMVDELAQTSQWVETAPVK